MTMHVALRGGRGDGAIALQPGGVARRLVVSRVRWDSTNCLRRAGDVNITFMVTRVTHDGSGTNWERRRFVPFPSPARPARDQPAAFTMSKIGRYIATTMPPTTTPRNTIIIGSISASRPDTAASTSSS